MKEQTSRKIRFYGRIAAAAAFLTASCALAPAQEGGAAPGAPAGHEMKGMGGMDHGAMGHGGMGGMMGQGGMEHGGMGHEMKGMGEMGGGMRGMMHEMLCGVTEHVEGRLAYLKAELKLADAQQAAWNNFADAYRAATQKTGKLCAAAEAQGDHAMHHGVLGHLGMMERHMSDHLESVRALKGAIEPLYAALTDEQKKIADHAFAHVMHVGMGGMGGMGGMSH